MASISKRVWTFVKHPLVSTTICVGGTYFVYEYIRKIQTSHKYRLGDLDGKTYIVTGANSGIGKQITMDLAMKNAQVIMACRDRNKCLEVRRDVVLRTRNKKVFCRMCDLSDMESVYNFAHKLTKGKYDFKKIDGIVLNAATKCKKYSANKNGIEMTLATNHLGSFLLVGLLLQKLLDQEGESRIVFIGTDIAMKDGLKLELDKVNSAKYRRAFLSATELLDPDKGTYDGHGAYKYSKLMQAVFARELAERLAGSKVRVALADPGGASTNLNKHEPSQKFFLTRWCSNGLGYLTGNRRAVEFAVFSVLYGIGDEGVQNGTYITSRRRIGDWGKNAECAELRNSVWAMSEQWTGLGEWMSKMEREMEAPGYFSKGEETNKSASARKGRSARYLWLA